MNGLVGVIFSNFFGPIDLTINLFGVANGLILWYAWSKTNYLYNSFNVSQNKTLPGFKPPELGEGEEGAIYNSLYNTWKESEGSYSAFVAITSIFPYLGILGTVLSLMMLVGSDASYAAQESFFIALTSTFFGVSWAILYRLLDAKIATKIQSNNDDMNRLKILVGRKQHGIKQDEAGE